MKEEKWRVLENIFDLWKSGDWKTTERTVVKHIVEDCQAGTVEGITIHEMRRATGVLEVNCYEVHSFVRHSYLE
jgi:hypothetical protein